ncbi:RNA polymerase sigma factor [Amphritea sp. HPY]|uniref:RNA polymerase sigma factor n=1 Tax=Amphritea sp. HPY TaxID=3421652 RepID=UPI003D7C63BF
MKLLNRESELLRALLNRDEQGYQFAVRKYSAGMLATALRLVDSATAEDVVQDAWVTVVDAIGSFEQRCSLQTWLNTITANRARSRLRRSWRELSLDQQDIESDFRSRFSGEGRWKQMPAVWDTVSPEQLLQCDELQNCLNQHISSLPENLRTVLQLRDISQLEADQICNILDLSASNFRVMLHRARQRVYLMVEHFEETGQC